LSTAFDGHFREVTRPGTGCQIEYPIPGGNRPEMFNVETDPAERRSVIAKHPKLAKELEEELKAWLATETEAAKWGKAAAAK
jgi:hypothetical protein